MPPPTSVTNNGGFTQPVPNVDTSYLTFHEMTATTLCLIGSFAKFIAKATRFIFSIISTLLFIGSIILFATGSLLMGAITLTIAFLASPFGIHAGVAWVANLANKKGKNLWTLVLESNTRHQAKE